MRTVGMIVAFVSLLGASKSSESVHEEPNRGRQSAELSSFSTLLEVEGERRGSIQHDTVANATSVSDGVYSATQASSGEDLFQRACETCHQSAEFEGPRFRFRWRDASVADIYELISTSMPQGDPGSLSPEEYASIIAYFLSRNDYPPGSRPLPADPSILGDLRFGVSTD